MFNIFLSCWKVSRWPNASKCKKMIISARCRLMHLTNRSTLMTMQLRKDLAHLIRDGQEQTAFNRVEQLMQDERLVAAYELLDHFLVFILEKFSFIRKNKDCPPDIIEAVSGLIFASARCGNFPELYAIRKIFGQRYGEDFVTAAVELFPGNLVNAKLIENLSVMTMLDDQKYMVVDEIARENCLQPEVKDCKGSQLEELESDVQMNHAIAESTINPSEVEETDSEDSFNNSSISKSSKSFSLPDSTSTETSALVSSVQQYPPYLTNPLLQKEVEKENFPNLQNKGEIMALLTSSERVDLLPCTEETIEYCVDENEEYQNLSLKVYYRKPCKSSSTQKYAKRKAFNLDSCDCSLDQPCYCCIYCDQECYSRAFTMIPEWHKNCKDNLLRISQQPKHVHPRLPKFEDIVTTFTALKRETVHH